MTININIDLNICPKDNFYLQWSYIYWWQLELNLQLTVKNAMCELIKEGYK